MDEQICIWKCLSAGGRIGSPGSSGQLGQSVFDYIEKLSGRSPVFHNFLYMGERISDSTVIFWEDVSVVDFGINLFIVFRWSMELFERRMQELLQDSQLDDSGSGSYKPSD